MELFRLTRKKYSNKLSGKGAAINGARWNSIGVEMIYTAENRSLAMAEVSVHFSLATIPDDYMMITIYVPDNVLVTQLDIKTLEKDWNAFPHRISTKRLGDAFIASSNSCILKVPSAVTQGDFSYLINPSHADFIKLKIIDVVPFKFDNRIF